jgi:D-sedoheptulose 7-phosphate isomerase
MTAPYRDIETPDAPTAMPALAYLELLAEVVQSVPREPLERALELLLEAQMLGRRIYVMGNGGSASIASQFVCNFAKTATVDGVPPMRAFALTDNTPSLTAWANDFGYDQIFAGQIAALVEPGDVVIGISVSGKSPNIVAGLLAATDAGARTIGLLGFDGGHALNLVDVAVHIPYDDYGLVEDTHMAIGHALTRAIVHHLRSARLASPPHP